ncbi:Myeloid Cell Nuclear Differentiation Antigen [Manis pentadactyla]|nr:Myeloid Cell Nuclear Differentiation Antigen [Manis pentadactyla]
MRQCLLSIRELLVSGACKNSVHGEEFNSTASSAQRPQLEMTLATYEQDYFSACFLVGSEQTHLPSNTKSARYQDKNLTASDLGYCGEFSVRFIHTLRHAAQKMRPKAIPPQERRFQGKAGPATPTASTDSALRAEKPVKAPVAQKRKKTVKEKTGTKRGILEINEASSVSEAGADEPVEVPNRIVKRANETPKIDNLYKQASGTLVYGLFMLHKKRVNVKNTIYEIQDNTGKMAVVGKGKWHNIRCKEGDKLRLFCFQLRTIDQKLKLTCGNHSFIQVIKTRKAKINQAALT